jgi:hypothetical protein
MWHNLVDARRQLVGFHVALAAAGSHLNHDGKLQLEGINSVHF